MSLAPLHMLMPIRIQLSEEITHRLEAKTCLIKAYYPKYILIILELIII